MVRRNPRAQTPEVAVAAASKLKFWAPPILWMGVIFYISSMKASDLPEVGIPFADKVFHFFEFFVLGVLVTRAISKSSPRMTALKAFAISVAFASIYAVFDEWHQMFSIGRMADLIDLIFDVFGLVSGTFIYLTGERKDKWLQ